MRYRVTYQVAGEERTDELEAPDAAAAANAVREAHGRSADLFELILVHLVDDEKDTGQPSEPGGAPGA